MTGNIWGSGDPTKSIANLYYATYNDHHYLKWANIKPSKDSRISTPCSDLLDSNTPTIVGEWSLSVADGVESNSDFYNKWFATQITAYEKQQGLVFGTWKTQLGDYRWSYQGLSSSFSPLWVLGVSVWLTFLFRCDFVRCDSNGP